mmetsp:Transcript_86948/g.188129  ORF Transcript_86948/g.188129 Transcript_86948/m.188129 type:complete len:249 (-) Transcript_86948:284-1030(-)
MLVQFTVFYVETQSVSDERVEVFNFHIPVIVSECGLIKRLIDTESFVDFRIIQILAFEVLGGHRQKRREFIHQFVLALLQRDFAAELHERESDQQLQGLPADAIVVFIFVVVFHPDHLVVDCYPEVLELFSRHVLRSELQFLQKVQEVGLRDLLLWLDVVGVDCHQLVPDVHKPFLVVQHMSQKGQPLLFVDFQVLFDESEYLAVVDVKGSQILQDFLLIELFNEFVIHRHVQNRFRHVLFADFLHLL